MKSSKIKSKSTSLSEKAVRKDLRKFIEELERTDHYVPSPKDVLRTLKNQEKDAPKVTCGNCGYNWSPNPYLWKDEPDDLHLKEHKGELIRPIICPACNTKNKMDLKTVFLITDWWQRHKILGDILKEEAERARKKYGYSITATEAVRG